MKDHCFSYTRPKKSRLENASNLKLFVLKNNYSHKEVLENRFLSSNYARKNEQKKGTSLFVIIAGGEKKELKYFENLDSLVPNGMAIPIIFGCPIGFNSGANKDSHRGSSPSDIVSFWHEVFNPQTKVLVVGGRPIQLSEDDKIYFVSDVDEFESDLIKYVCGMEFVPNVKWVISNPCFEVWLYFSFLGTPQEEHISMIKSSPLSSRSNDLKRLCNRSHSGGMDPRRAPENMKKAVDAATIYGYKEDAHCIPTLFCSSMLHFCQDFLNYTSSFSN